MLPGAVWIYLLSFSTFSHTNFRYPRENYILWSAMWGAVSVEHSLLDSAYYTEANDFIEIFYVCRSLNNLWTLNFKFEFYFYTNGVGLKGRLHLLTNFLCEIKSPISRNTNVALPSHSQYLWCSRIFMFIVVITSSIIISHLQVCKISYRYILGTISM